MELLPAIDPGAPVPLHRQVYDAIREAILSGRLRPGERVPASRLLADQLSVSRQTVTDAYDQLQTQGYLAGRQGSGTFVAPQLPEEALTATNRAEPETPRPRAWLSAWGTRVSAAPVRQEPGDLPYDLRPHRVAGDMFPWDAWSSAVERALARARGGLLQPPPPAGDESLRAAIASHVRTHRAVECSPEQVVVVNGSQQGVNLLTLLLLEPGDRVAMEDPGYPSARLAFEARGLDVRRVPVDAEGMVVDRLRATEQRLIHVTPSHQDPTGATLSLARRLALLEIAERGDALVIEDDYDSEFRYEGRPVESLQGLDRGSRVIYAGTFSKSVLAGLRIGFLVLPLQLAGPFVSAKSLWDGGTPMLEQAALAEFMLAGDYERHIRRMRRLYRSRRDALLTGLREAFGSRVEVGHRHGGLNVLVTIDQSDSAEEIAARAARLGVVVRPATTYYSRPPERPTFLVGFAALPEGLVGESLARFADATLGDDA